MELILLLVRFSTPRVRVFVIAVMVLGGSTFAVDAESARAVPDSASFRAPLGHFSPSQSPGAVVGLTLYDEQHRGTMGRMVGWSTHGQPETLIVHFGWTYTPDITLTQREYRYNSWNSATGTLGQPVGLQPYLDYAGYVGIAATGDGRAVIGGHNRELFDWWYDCQFYWDSLPGAGNFVTTAQVPHSLSTYQGPSNQMVIWPKFQYQEGPTDTVLHVIAWTAQDPPYHRGLYYFRKVGGGAAGVWDDPPRIVDSIDSYGYDVAAGASGKVALAWIANLPCPGDPCDTCSGYDCRTYPEEDNDLYCQVSLDQGATWQPRTNVTHNVDTVDGFRPYIDLSVLITADDNLHVVWNARTWPIGGPPDLLSGMLFHWSENVPQVRTVHEFDWEQTTCDGGVYQLNATKMTISECDGKLYVIFVQFNDIPNGIEADCATPSSQNYPTGAANGDLYVAISENGGVTWDDARNITNSRTPGCDSIGGNPCESDHWVSMAPHGTAHEGDFSIAPIVVPDGSVDPGTYYLDVQYINDHAAGTIVSDEGFWSEADVRWFRLACVNPLTTAELLMTPDNVDYPTWTGHGVQLDRELVLTNAGSGDLDYTISIEEDTGPSGWLTYSGLGGVLPAGLNNVDTGAVHLNTGGIVYDPGEAVGLSGRLIFDSNAPTSPDTFEVSLLVVDTLYTPVWDTVSTPCTRLTLSSHGNIGNQGLGGCNLDFALSGDCDTAATIYLYDGSPVVGFENGSDTVVGYSVYGTSFTDPAGLVPIDSHTATIDSGSFEVFRSAASVTRDSLIAVRQIWYASQTTDSCEFLIQRIDFSINRDTTLSGIRIGEVIDWDIPSDTFRLNGSGFDSTRWLIWQVGAEFHQDDTIACQDNDRRFGGVALVDRYVNGVQDASGPHGAATADNATYVYPNNGLYPAQLYTRMADPGWQVYESVNPDSQYVDLHTLMTFDVDQTLAPGDTITYYLAVAAIQNGTAADLQASADRARRWYCNHLSPVSCGCCNTDGMRGDADNDCTFGCVTVADLSYLVTYLFQQGPQPVCEDEGNADGDCTFGCITVSDLSYLVTHLFQGGPAPLPCP